MPRILRIINRFNLGGITYNVSYLSRYLPAGYETMLIGGPEETGEESSLFIPEGMGLKPMVISEMRRSLNPFKDYFAYRRICRIIREFKPDIVHTHASKAGALGRLAAWRCGVPVVVHTFHGHVFHGYFGDLRTGFIKATERFLAKKTNAIVAISRIQKDELTLRHRLCDPAHVRVIPLGFDLARFTENMDSKRKAFREKYRINENEIAIGIVGRLAPIKNHFMFIEAIKHLADHRVTAIKAIVIGDGEVKPRLTGYAIKAGLCSSSAEDKDVLVFAGWIREVDIALAGLDIICLTSDNEGTPVSLIEAQAAGKYIVSTDVGGIRDILHPGCGELCDAGDQEAFNRSLEKAVLNFSELQKKAAAGSEITIEKFSYKRLCNEMTQLYDELLGIKSRERSADHELERQPGLDAGN